MWNELFPCWCWAWSAGVGDQLAENDDSLGEAFLLCGIQPFQVRVDGCAAIQPGLVQCRHTGRGDPDQHRAGISRIRRAGDHSCRLEPSYLGGHRGLRTMVEGGQVGDACLALVLDGGQQTGLRKRDRHPDTLVGQPIDSGHHREQIGAKCRRHAPLLRSLTMYRRGPAVVLVTPGARGLNSMTGRIVK